MNISYVVSQKCLATDDFSEWKCWTFSTINSSSIQYISPEHLPAAKHHAGCPGHMNEHSNTIPTFKSIPETGSQTCKLLPWGSWGQLL